MGHTEPKPIRRCHAFAEVTTASTEADVEQQKVSTTEEYTSSSNYSSVQYSEFLTALKTSKEVAVDTKQTVEAVGSEQASAPVDDVENVVPKDSLPNKALREFQAQKAKPSLRSLAVQRGTATRSKKNKSQKHQQQLLREQREQQRQKALQQFLTKVNSSATPEDGSACKVKSESTAVQTSPGTNSAAAGEELVETVSEPSNVTPSEDLSLLTIVNAAAIFVVLCAGAIMFWTA